MSRSYCSYDEDWQRRKSILVRSLFHDLPILSPVTEESDDSYPPVRSYEPLEEPQRPYSPLPPLIVERVPKINKHDEPEEHYKQLIIKIKRIYRRLFILNRNLSSDEEFFSDRSITDHGDDLDNPIAINNDDDGLHSPITNAIDDAVNEAEESNDLDDDTDDDQSHVNDNTNSNEENIRKSSDFNVSNGYKADSESIETVIVDVLNYTKSTNEEASKNTTEASKASEELEEESESISLEGESESNSNKSEDRRSGNQEAGDNESSCTIRKDNREGFVKEESNVSLTSNQEKNARLTAVRTVKNIIDDIGEMNEQKMIEEESDDKSITDRDTKYKSNNVIEKNNQENRHQEELIEIISEEKITDQEMLEEKNNEKRITSQSSKSSITTEESNQSIPQEEITDTLREELQNRFEDMNKSRMNIENADEDKSDDSSTSDEEWSGEESESLEEENSKELSASTLEEIENALELEAEGEERRRVELSAAMMEEDEVEVMSDRGSHFRQITTIAQVHVDAPQDLPEIESQVYEGSPKSIILPVRWMKRTAAQAMLDTREELIGVDETKKPRAEAITNSNAESSEDIEEMRSLQRKLSQATEPEITQESVSEESNKFIRTSHDLTDVTSSSRNGANFNISKRKTSDDLSEVLARILNESENNVKNIRLYRKRKNFEDISVQTSENVSWDDIRKDLFVGAPKIMRLCSCVDHVCQ